MNSGMELHQAIYQFYLCQIQFGFYQYGEKLPTLEETCRQFHTSLDTANPVYHRLRQEGYISLSQKAGAKVIVEYGPDEIEGNIQSFYGERKKSFIDLSNSVWPLLGQAQCYALKYGAIAAENRTDSDCRNCQPIYAIWKLLDREYNVLGNQLLMRLTRYLYLYFYGAFWGVIDNELLQEKIIMQIQTATALCLEKRWSQLPGPLHTIQYELNNALYQFYGERISIQSTGREISFCWDAYKKSSQLRYSLAMELLTEIGRGIYPVGSYLPSAERLSAIKGVSVSTVRRAVSLLDSIGAVKSSRPLGARVIPASQCFQNCDFSQPDYRRRLLDLAESLQIFAFSGRAVSQITLSSLDNSSLNQWKQYLYDLKNRDRCQRVIYASLTLISNHAPFQTLRIIYSELLRLLFWGNPLQEMMKAREADTEFLIPCFQHLLYSLEQKDISSFSLTLEALLFHELRKTVDVLLQLGIHEAENIRIPSGDYFDLQL